MLTPTRAIRFVRESHLAELEELLDLPEFRARVEAGAIASCRRASPGDGIPGEAGEPFAAAFECGRVPFVSYAAEWPPSLLWAAAKLTLDLATAFPPYGFGLKDATPSNIVFRGTSPVFVDHLSFERRSPADPIWLAHAQFVETFLIPLLLYARGLSPGRVYSSGSVGVTVDEAAAVIPLTRRLWGPAASLVTAPRLIAPIAKRLGDSLYERRETAADRAAFVLRRLFRGLERRLAGLAPMHRHSAWATYEDKDHSDAYHEAKRTLVAEYLEKLRPSSVLDVGCNVGTYSLIAARAGARVVAIDADVAAVERCAEAARASRADVLPLVVNAARPTPAVGWRNAEELSFSGRAEKQFDTVLALAIVHHLTVGAGVPLPDVIDELCSFAQSHLIVEFIPPDDPKFRQLVRGRSIDERSHSREAFERCCARCGHVVASEHIADTERRLYLVQISADARPV